MIPTRAYENGVYLDYANSAGEQNGMRFLGQSFVAVPNRQKIVRATGLPCIIFGVVDPQMVTAAQNRRPYLDDVESLKAAVGSS